MIRVTRPHKGFTLVELIVSVGLFAIVVTITMTAYLRLISIERRSRATNDVVTNLSFVVDSMARGIRTGTGYQCDGGTNCASGTKFSFVDENGQNTTYLLVPTANGNYVGECLTAAAFCTTTSNPLPTPVTDPNIAIQALNFTVIGSQRGDGIQPQVTFTIQGSTRIDARSAPVVFTIESGATQRYLDL